MLLTFQRSIREWSFYHHALWWMNYQIINAFTKSVWLKEKQKQQHTFPDRLIYDDTASRLFGSIILYQYPIFNHLSALIWSYLHNLFWQVINPYQTVLLMNADKLALDTDSIWKLTLGLCFHSHSQNSSAYCTLQIHPNWQVLPLDVHLFLLIFSCQDILQPSVSAT